jgi:ankyrin repeat protein
MSTGDIPVMEYLISKGANVNEVDDDGISILAWAAMSNRAAAIDLLARRGAKVNSVNQFGMTRLPHAASIDFGDTSVVEKLVALGADAKAKNKEGLTALI